MHGNKAGKPAIRQKTGNRKMHKSIRMLGPLASVLFMASCEENPAPHSRFSSGAFGQDHAVVSRTVSRNAANPDTAMYERSILQRGNGTFVDPSAISETSRSQAIAVPHGNSQVELSLVNASIAAAAEEILGKTLGLTYVISDKVEGRITLQTTSPVPKKALLDLFRAALEANGASIEWKDKVARIIRGTTGNNTFRMARDGAGESGAIIVAPLKYVSPNEMIGLMQPLVDDGLKVVPDKARNLLLISGSKASVEAGLDALNLFDVDVMRGKSVALVKLRAAEPNDVVAELTRIFEAQDGGALNGVIEFMPNQRLGSILIISSKAEYMDRARKWIRDFDQQATVSSRYLQTYDLHNRNADEVAPILDKLLSAGEGGSRTETSPDGTSSASASQVTYKVAADTSRNALIVRATQDEHKEISALLRDLDTTARQVLLEATIAEVTLNDEMNVGVRWYLESGNVATGFSDLDTGSVVGTYPGFTAVLSKGGAKAALSALAAVTDVKVISSPTLMVVDNQEGLLQIGDQVPVALQTASEASDTAVVLTQIEYRDTGIILKVRPRIGADGAVNLKIEQEVSDVSSTRSSGIDSPTISTRKVQTHAVLADGQTLTLGGLVQERDNKTRAEVPGLGRIPVVGGLFRNKESSKKRTELIIMIRPLVVHNAGQAGSVTAYWRDKLNGANSLLNTGLGSPRHRISEIVSE
ncbi:MAG: type II secretion system secretin GspD [Paracoccaceae bacterium]